MTPGFSMAITGSAPSGATAATAAAAGGTPCAAGSDAAATPGGFLGMLGNLVQASAPVTAQAATQAAAEPAAANAALSGDASQAATLSEALAPLLASLGADGPPAASPVKPSLATTDSTSDADPATTPEAAASAAAVLAQMLATAQPLAAATPPKLETAVATASPARQPSGSIPPSPADAAAIPAATDASPFAPAFALAAAGVATNAAALAAEDGTGEADATQAAAVQGSGSRPSAGTAQAAKPSLIEGLFSPAASTNTSQDNPTTDSSGFRSLASLLGAGAQRAEAGASVSTSSGPQPQALQAVLSQPAATGAAETVAADALPGRLRDPVGSAKWADALGARLTMMATRGEQHGSLRLSPEHLGPLEVQIRVQDDKATVWFGAQHADTRAALQDALPRLRELFAASGMQLGDAGVSREAPRQGRAQADLPASASGDTVAAEEAVLPAAVASVAHSGLVDTYA